MSNEDRIWMRRVSWFFLTLAWIGLASWLCGKYVYNVFEGWRF